MTLPVRSRAPLNPLQLQGPASRVNWPVEGSYRAGVESEGLPLEKPPVANTSPFKSSGVIGLIIVVPVLPVALQVAVEGLYSSDGVLIVSPMASTSPSCNNAAFGPPMLLVGLPVADQVPVAGLYSSALVPSGAASTCPLGSNVRLNPQPAVIMLPVAVQVPVEGLYSSALARVPLAFWPPATSTWPFCNRTAWWLSRGTFMLPVSVHVPFAGLYSSALAR